MQTVTDASTRKARGNEPAPPERVPQEQLDALTRALAATAADHDRSGLFPEENFRLLHQAGLLGLTVPRVFGGRGAGLGEAIRVLGAIAQGEPSTALILFMTYAYYAGSFSRTSSWPRHVYERMAREAASEIALIGGLRVEPELGTPVRGGLPATVARQVEGGYRITGRKIYSTGSTGLRWYGVWAKTDEPEPRVGTFLVRARTPGVRIEPTWEHFGMRASVSHDVVFEDAFTPAEHAVDVRAPADWAPKPGDGTSPMLWNGLGISSIYDGVARSARDWLVSYLKQRAPSNLGAPLSTLPRVQEKVGEIEARLHANRVLLESAAARADRGEPVSAVEANLIKYTTTDNSIRAVQIGLELTGNPGLSRHNPLERHYRDVTCSRIHSPQNDTILVSAGRAAFGG